MTIKKKTLVINNPQKYEYIEVYSNILYISGIGRGGGQGERPPPPSTAPKPRKFTKDGDQTLDNPAKLVRPSKKT